MTTLCRALRARDAGAVRNLLPYYQYNSGVRYGSLGDGEGRTGDPAIVQTWLSGSTVRCAFFTPDSSGHAVLLTSGWSLPGGWSLIEADTFGGAWKINDFTFGGRSALWAAMTQTSSPVVVYRG